LDRCSWLSSPRPSAPLGSSPSAHPCPSSVMSMSFRGGSPSPPPPAAAVGDSDAIGVAAGRERTPAFSFGAVCVPPTAGRAGSCRRGAAEALLLYAFALLPARRVVLIRGSALWSSCCGGDESGEWWEGKESKCCRGLAPLPH